MADERNRSGTDLDIFEGLGKPRVRTSTVPEDQPPPSVPGAIARRPAEAKRTLLGIPGPALLGKKANAAAAPPPAPPTPQAPQPQPEPKPAAQWDDDIDDTHVFKQKEKELALKAPVIAEAPLSEEELSATTSPDGVLAVTTGETEIAPSSDTLIKSASASPAKALDLDPDGPTLMKTSDPAIARPAVDPPTLRNSNPAVPLQRPQTVPIPPASESDPFADLIAKDEKRPEISTQPVAVTKTVALAAARTNNANETAPLSALSGMQTPPPLVTQGATPPPPPSQQLTPSQPSYSPSYPISAPPSQPRILEPTRLTRTPTNKLPLMLGILLAVMIVAAGIVFFVMPRSGTLIINVADPRGGEVKGLEIQVDGVKRCETAPCVLPNTAPGIHQVVVIAKNYEPLAPRAVSIDGKHDAPADFKLTPLKIVGTTGFKAATTNVGVHVYVDGADRGVLPTELRDLEAGEHKLRFAGERYAPLEKTLTVQKDEIADVGTITLKVLKGKATIQLGTPGAKVYLVNGTNRKEVPQFPMAIEFDPNEKWDLLAVKDGFDDFHERIAFDDGVAEKTINVILPAKGTGGRPPAVPGSGRIPSGREEGPNGAANAETALKINSIPASSVILDGKTIGQTPQPHVPVSPGSHTITFVNAEQSLKKTVTVEVKAGEVKPVSAKLRE